MIQIRKAEDRGHFDHGWLKTYHTFSFADYHDPKWMGFRSLRVINEDYVKPGEGFPTHSHRDMEIITYILEGALEHKDSLGTGSVIKPGEVQRMSAGTGVSHSEYNPSKKETVHLLQIWILPEQEGIKPSYEQKSLESNVKNQLQLIVSRENGKAVKIHQDVKLYTARLDQNSKLTYPINRKRYGWLQVAKGTVSLNNQTLKAGDGAAIENEETINVNATQPSEILLFDLN